MSKPSAANPISRVLRRKRMVDRSKLRPAGTHHPGGGRIAAIVNRSFETPFPDQL